MRASLAITVALIISSLMASVASSGQKQMAGASAAEGNCADYIVIDSRGSGERGGLSAPAAVFYPTFRAAVIRRDPSAKVSVIRNGYPAWGSIPTLIAALAKLPQQYHKSVVAGKNWLSGRIGALLANCPNSKLVLTGYSQGAQVTADVYQNTSSRNIIGIVLFGDPKFNSADPAARGGKSGLDGALGTRRLFTVAPGKRSLGHVLSYCHDRDPVCQGLSRLRYGSTYHRYDGTGEPQAAANYLAGFVLPRTVLSDARACGGSAYPAGPVNELDQGACAQDQSGAPITASVAGCTVQVASAGTLRATLYYNGSESATRRRAVSPGAWGIAWDFVNVDLPAGQWRCEFTFTTSSGSQPLGTLSKEFRTAGQSGPLVGAAICDTARRMPNERCGIDQTGTTIGATQSLSCSTITVGQGGKTLRIDLRSDRGWGGPTPTWSVVIRSGYVFAHYWAYWTYPDRNYDSTTYHCLFYLDGALVADRWLQVS